MILQIDVTVTGTDGTTSSASVAVDVTVPTAAHAEQDALQRRSIAQRWGGSRA